jgi:hypothetical protein
MTLSTERGALHKTGPSFWVDATFAQSFSGEPSTGSHGISGRNGGAR